MNSLERKLELKNPPVVEAVIDISVKQQATSFNDGRYLPLDKKNFPTQKPIHKIESRFNISAEKDPSASHTKTMIGYSYESEDQKSLIQHRVNGFSYHRLGNYCGWDNLLLPAMANWSDYKNSQETLEIQRLGLRFINLIETGSSPSSFLKFHLAGAKKIGKLSNFQYQFLLELKSNYSATVGLRPIDQSGSKYLLDIDIFCTANQIKSTEIKNHFECMRDEKNKLFVSSLTKKALKLYE